MVTFSAGTSKGFELIAKPAQSSKPLFNIKENRLLHDPYSNQRKENEITEAASKPVDVSNPPGSTSNSS